MKTSLVLRMPACTPQIRYFFKDNVLPFRGEVHIPPMGKIRRWGFPSLIIVAFKFPQVHLASPEARAPSYHSHGTGQHMGTIPEGQLG